MHLISFEGIDGSGKSTQIELLENYLKELSIPVYKFREPGGSSISEQIRSILLDSKNEINDITELLLFSAARAQLIGEKVMPLLNLNSMGVIILDRFYDSTVAYQGFGRGVGNIEQIKLLNEIATFGIKPHLSIYLNIDLKTSIDRRSAQENDRMEQATNDFFEKVICGYEYILKKEPNRFKSVDAKKDVNQVHDQVISLINQTFDFSV